MSPSLAERTIVNETKIEVLEEKLDDLRHTVNDNHNRLMDQLDNMREISCKQHAELASQLEQTTDSLKLKITNLEKLKDKWQLYAIAFLAFLAGCGWLHAINLPTILKFLGI